MRTKSIWGLAAIAALLMQGCTKDSRKQQAGGMPANVVKAPVGSTLAIDPSKGYATFQFISAKDYQSVQVAGLSMLDGGTGEVAAYTGSEMQQWRVTLAGNNYYTFMNDGSGKFATSYSSNGTQTLIQSSATTALKDAQLWSVISVGDGIFKVISKTSGLAVTEADSGKLKLMPYANNSSQWWGCSQLQDMAYKDDQVVQFFHRLHGSIAFDQGTSIPLSDGRTIWIGCDTYSDASGGWIPADGKYKCYGNVGQFLDLRNSALIQPASQSWDQAQTDNLNTTNTPYKYQILASPDSLNPGSHGTNYTWPGIGIQLGSHVFMYAHEGSGDGYYNKTVWYDFNYTAGNNWGKATRHEINGVSTQQDIDYTDGIAKPGDGYVYVYGNSNVFLVKLLHVARFAENDPAHWQFWNGTTWGTTPVNTDAEQIPVNGGTTKIALSNCAVSYVNGKYVLVEMDYGYGCPDPTQPHNIYISTSSSPLGPFSQRKAVYAVVDQIYGYPCNYYIPSIHPQFNNGKNELLVTYDLNFTACSGFNVCKYGELDPFYYQVKAIRIPYALAGL